MPGVKREPSSFVHATTSIGCRVAMPCSFSVADRLEAREHAIDAVEAAAERLRVEMAAAHHGRRIRLRAGPPREQVADRIDADLAAGRLAPCDEAAPAAHLVVAQREPAAAAARGRADRRHLHQRIPQSLPVDAHHRRRS